MNPTTSSLREIWSELNRDSGTAATGLRLRLALSSGGVRAFAAVTAREGLPALLLEFSEAVRPHSLKPLITRAFQMTAPSLDGLPVGRWALLIELKDHGFSDLFEVLASDVFKGIQAATAEQTALQATLHCIQRWRLFVERKGGPLSGEEVKGLIGELIVLCRCVRHIGADAAVTAWKGPERALRDFELPEASVEVKTYQGDDAATVLISSPDQLDAVAQRPVYLAAVRLTPSDMRGYTLGEFVIRTTGVIGADIAAAAMFEERLALAGYLGAHAQLYADRFLAGPVMTYAVTPGFPRIRSSDVPQGVLNVRFGLSIPALAPFRMAAVAIIGDRVPEMEVV